jgi:peptidoglycan/LPS O-acetylase OafA/YrhL
MTQEKQRLLGVDLCRGFSAYAVVLAHSGDETWKLPLLPGAIEFRLWFYFAVPFFLATSFYFMVAKMKVGFSIVHFWRSRVERILIPYCGWSVFYLITKLMLFQVTGQSLKRAELLQDPLALIFFGNVSHHLYFLPLLFTGSSLLIVAWGFSLDKIALWKLAVLVVMSLLLYTVLSETGNNFELHPSMAFKPILALMNLSKGWFAIARLLFVQLAWLIRCLPYLFIAIFLHRWLQKDQSKILHNPWVLGLISSLFVIVNSVGKMVIPDAIHEVLIAYLLLLLGISLSGYIRDSKILTNLGLCTFGIYLLHPFMMNVLDPILRRIAPFTATQVSIASMLCFSILTFFTTWVAVSRLMQNRIFAKYS